MSLLLKPSDFGESWRTISTINTVTGVRTGVFPENDLHTGILPGSEWEPGYWDLPQSNISDLEAVPLIEELKAIVQ